MPEIVLATLNAKYIHAAFGLRYLLANMGELQERTALAEFEINQRPLEIVERCTFNLRELRYRQGHDYDDADYHRQHRNYDRDDRPSNEKVRHD